MSVLCVSPFDIASQLSRGIENENNSDDPL